jgi:ERCC4-related helicase
MKRASIAFQIIEGRYDVVVITAGCLLSQIDEKRSLSIEMFHTIVLDEVHHATGKHNFCAILAKVIKYEIWQ